MLLSCDNDASAIPALGLHPAVVPRHWSHQSLPEPNSLQSLAHQAEVQPTEQEQWRRLLCSCQLRIKNLNKGKMPETGVHRAASLQIVNCKN